MQSYTISWDLIDELPYFNPKGEYSIHFSTNKPWVGLFFDTVGNNIVDIVFANSKSELITYIITDVVREYLGGYKRWAPPDAEQDFILDHLQHELIYKNFVILEEITTAIYIIKMIH